MITLSIDHIAASIHSLTALAAYLGQSQPQIPAMLTSERRDALAPLITDTTLRIAAQLQLQAAVDGDIITLDCDTRCEAMAQGLAEVVRCQVMSQLYALTAPRTSLIWHQMSQTSLTRLTQLTDAITPEAGSDALLITPHY